MTSNGIMFILPYRRVGELEMGVIETDTWWPHLTLFLLQEGKQANKRTPKLIPFRLCSQVLHTPAPRPSIARGCRRPAVSQVLPSARIRTESILCVLTERWLHHVANFNLPQINAILGTTKCCQTRTHGNFEDQNMALESFIIITNYCIIINIIIIAYYIL